MQILDPEHRAKWSTTLIMATVVLAMIGVFHPQPYDEVTSRWGLARELVEDGEITIDPYTGFTVDRVRFGAHVYSSRPILASALASLVYLPIHLLKDIVAVNEILPRYFTERVLVGGSFLLLLVLMAGMGPRKSRRETIPLLALGLGSILLPYSTLLYAQVPAAMLIFLAWRLQEQKRFALADLAGAAASALVYQVLILYFILVAYRGFRYWTPLRALRVPAMLLVAYSPQLAYNWLAFGNPLSTAFTLNSGGVLSDSGLRLIGLSMPDASTLWTLLLSPERGLLFYMPWAAVGFMGFLRGGAGNLRRDPGAALVIAFIILCSAQVVTVTSWSFGPSHLIPVIPFLAAGLYRFVHGSPRRGFIAMMLVAPAVFQMFLGVFGEIHLPVHHFATPIPVPQWNICLRMMMDGHHSVWFADLLGPLTVFVLSLYAMAGRFQSTKFTWKGLIWIPLMIILILPSATRDWGGRIDYYRGILAEHREEYALASYYYFNLVADPTAPKAVRERAVWCLQQATGVRHTGPDSLDRRDEHPGPHRPVTRSRRTHERLSATGKRRIGS